MLHITPLVLALLPRPVIITPRVTFSYCLADIEELRRVSEKEKGKALPQKIAAIKARGSVVWSDKEPSPEFKDRFEARKIPVVGIRHVRVWGIQVDDERELPGHERTTIPDEELWQVELKAKDGSSYEVNSNMVEPAPE